MDNQIRFRNKVQNQGFSILHHVVTLDKDLSDGAFRLYALLLKYAQQKDHAYPGVDRLAQDLGVHRNTITNRLEELEEYGLISRQRRFGTSSMTWIEDLNTIYDTDPEPDPDPEPEEGEGESNRTDVRMHNELCDSGTKSCATVAQDFVRKEQEVKEQEATTTDDVVVALTKTGIAQSVAESLADRYSERRILEVIDAAEKKASTNPAGWIRKALTQDWSVDPPGDSGFRSDEERARLAALEAATVAAQKGDSHAAA